MLTEMRKADKVREPQLAERLEKAAELHPHCPPKHFGQRTWLVAELEKHGITTSPETVRKWFAGETRPRPHMLDALSEILGVDRAWLEYGDGGVVAKRPSKFASAAQRHEVDGAVALVTGLIQLDGGKVDFPGHGTPDGVHLFATIRGTRYPLHIAAGVAEGDKVKFSVPADLNDVIVIGVVRRGLSTDLFDITEDDMRRYGNDGSSLTLIEASPDDLRRIEGFTTRL